MCLQGFIFEQMSNDPDSFDADTLAKIRFGVIEGKLVSSIIQCLRFEGPLAKILIILGNPIVQPISCWNHCRAESASPQSLTSF